MLKKIFIKKFTLLLEASASLLLTALTACTSVPDTHTVEAIIPLSGQYSAYGKRLKTGMETAVVRLNKERSAQGKPALVLSITDTQSSTQSALNAFRRVIKNDPAAVIGPGPTDEARRLVYGANQAAVPLVMPIASGDYLTARGRYLYRICSTDSDQAEALSLYLREELNVEEIAVLIDLHTEGTYGRNLTQDISRCFRGMGGKVTATEGFHNADMTFRDQLNRIIAASPDGIFIPAIAPAAALFVREARLLGYEGWIIGGDAMAEPEFYKHLEIDPGKILFASQYSPEIETPEGRVFKEEFTNLHSYAPGDCESLGYDAVLVAVHAVESDPVFNEGWKKTEGLELTYGAFTLDTDSSSIHPVYLNTVERDAETGRCSVKFIKKL